MMGVDTKLSRVERPAAGMKMGSLAGVLLNVLLVAFSLGISLLLAEAAVRFAAPQLTYRFPRDLFVADPAVSYRLRPGFHGTASTPEYRTELRVTAQGLRDEREYGAKPAGVTRVLAIGDSFTMGVGVDLENTLVKRVQGLLGADGAARRVEILNGGVAGYSTNQEVTFLDAYGTAFEPDLVVLGFFIGNDIAENGGEPLAVQDGYLGTAHETHSGTLPVSVRRFLGLHSQLYHLLWPIPAPPPRQRSGRGTARGGRARPALRRRRRSRREDLGADLRRPAAPRRARPRARDSRRGGADPRVDAIRAQGMDGVRRLDRRPRDRVRAGRTEQTPCQVLCGARTRRARPTSRLSEPHRSLYAVFSSRPSLDRSRERACCRVAPSLLARATESRGPLMGRDQSSCPWPTS